MLKDVSFTAKEGLTCIMAPSGEGKTTLLRLLMGLERPDSGCVHLPRDCRWAAVFQEDRLLEQLDAEENLRFVLGSSYDGQQAKALLERLGLTEWEGKPVSAFSGGMKRRLALARALLVPFDVLVLDEPFTGLDEGNRRRAMDCIRQAAEGRCVLLVTHEASDAMEPGANVLRL